MPKTAAVMSKEEWLPGERAMQQLGKSERSIQRLAAAGHLRFKQDGLTKRRLYHAGDVERVKEEGIRTEREEPHRALGHRALALPPVTSLALSPETLAFVRDFGKQIVASRVVPPTEKLWLTINEAAAYSGLARSTVLILAKRGKIKACKSGGWKILRKSLESFAG